MRDNEPVSIPSSGKVRPDLTGLSVAAAVAWFEMVSLLALVAGVVLSPMLCFADPRPSAPPPCSNGIPFSQDGTALGLFIWLVAIAVIVIALWLVTGTHPRARGIALGILGICGLVPVGLVLANGELVLAAVPFLWSGVPALLLLRTAYRLLDSAQPDGA